MKKLITKHFAAKTIWTKNHFWKKDHNLDRSIKEHEVEIWKGVREFNFVAPHEGYCKEIETNLYAFCASGSNGYVYSFGNAVNLRKLLNKRLDNDVLDIFDL